MQKGGATIDTVRAQIAAEVSIPTAIKECLGGKLNEFAREVGVHYKTVSMAINGDIRPPQRVVDGLIARMGGTDAEWRELLWLAGRPVAVVG